MVQTCSTGHDLHALRNRALHKRLCPRNAGADNHHILTGDQCVGRLPQRKDAARCAQFIQRAAEIRFRLRVGNRHLRAEAQKQLGRRNAAARHAADQHTLAVYVHIHPPPLVLQNAQQRNHAENSRRHHIHGHDLRLVNAAKLKMVMNRRHFEDTLAMRLFEICDLDDIREAAHQHPERNQHQNQRLAQQHGRGHHRAADKHRAGIAHEHLRRIGVAGEERHARAAHRRAPHAEAPQRSRAAEHGERREIDHGNAGQQAVKAVEQVGAVGRAHDDEHHNRDIPDAQIPFHAEERHLDNGADLRVEVAIAGERQRQQRLKDHLLLGGQAAVLALADLALFDLGVLSRGTFDIIHTVLNVLMWIMAVLTVVSGMQYIVPNFDLIKNAK